MKTLIVLFVIAYQACGQEPPDTGSRIFLTGSGVIPDYSQLLNVNISDTVGLLCQGGITTKTVHWVLPDSTILVNNATNTGANVRVTTLSSRSLGLFAVNGSRSLSLVGVYICVVKFQDSGVGKQHIWITNENNIPLVDEQNSVCTITAVDPFNFLLTVSASGQITNGAGTNYTCEGKEISEFRSIDTAISPTRMTIIEFIYILFSPLPTEVNCIVSNSAGEDVLKCTYQNTPVTTPSITTSERDSNNISLVVVKWITSTPTSGSNQPLSLYYSAYAQASEDDEIIIGTIVDDSEAIFDKLLPWKSYGIIVATFNQQTNSKIMPLPITSEKHILSAVQCNPSTAYDLKINLDSDEETLCNKIATQSSFFTELYQAVINEHSLSSDNCTVIDPKISSFTCQEKSSKPKRTKHTKTKPKTELKINIIVFCNSCKLYEVNATQSSTRKKKGHKQRSKSKQSSIKLKETVNVNGINLTTHLKSIQTLSYCDNNFVNIKDTCDCPQQCF